MILGYLPKVLVKMFEQIIGYYKLSDQNQRSPSVRHVSVRRSCQDHSRCGSPASH